MAGHVDGGLEIIRKGLELAGNDHEHAAVADRARQLLQQFGG